MSVLEFIANVVRAIAWPMAISFVAFWLRSHLGAALGAAGGRVTNVRAPGGLEVQFGIPLPDLAHEAPVPEERRQGFELELANGNVAVWGVVNVAADGRDLLLPAGETERLRILGESAATQAEAGASPSVMARMVHDELLSLRAQIPSFSALPAPAGEIDALVELAAAGVLTAVQSAVLMVTLADLGLADAPENTRIFNQTTGAIVRQAFTFLADGVHLPDNVRRLPGSQDPPDVN
jgi:hypothetical protein